MAQQRHRHSLECLAASCQLPQQYAKGVDITGRTGSAVEQQLWRHMSESALHVGVCVREVVEESEVQQPQGAV